MTLNRLVMVLAGAGLSLMPATARAQSSSAAAAQKVTPVVAAATSFSYARLGYGGLFGDRTYGMPGFGFGFRAERENLGLDISFLNFQISTDNTAEPDGGVSGSWVKLEVLRYLRSGAARTVYAGGGLSLGSTGFGEGSVERDSDGTFVWRTPYEGRGLQGELTVGYEIARHSTMRIFAQVDATLPLYSVVSVSEHSRSTTADRRYAPSVALSLGMGWGKRQD